MDIADTGQALSSNPDEAQEKAYPQKDEEPQKDTEQHEYVTGWKLASAIISVTFVAFLINLDTSIISTAIPRITTDFHSLEDVGWYGSAYLLASSSLLPLSGKLYSLYSVKWTFLVFFGIFELGSLLCGVSQSSKMFIVARAVAGSGSAGLLNGSLTIIAACVPLEQRPKYLGFMMSVAQIGTVLGPLIGGLLTQYTTWRWCFYINLPPGALVATLLFLIRIPERSGKKVEDKSTIQTVVQKLDLLGFVFFAPAAIQFLLALEWGGSRYRWNSATIIGLFCGAAGTFAIFLAIERRKGDHAMVPFSIIRRRIVACGCLVQGFFGANVFVFLYFLPIYFQAVRDATPTMSGVYLLPSVIVQILFAMISGFLVSRLGYYLPWAIGGGVLISISNGLLSTLTPTTSTAKWIGYQIIGGAGRGSGFQMAIVAIQNALPVEQVPEGMSLVIFSQMLGTAMFLSFGQTALSNGLINNLATMAPGVNAQSIIAAGASGVRAVVTQAQLPGVLRAYNKALNDDFYLATGASVAVFCLAFGMGWKNIKKAKVVKPEA